MLSTTYQRNNSLTGPNISVLDRPPRQVRRERLRVLGDPQRGLHRRVVAAARRPGELVQGPPVLHGAVHILIVAQSVGDNMVSSLSWRRNWWTCSISIASTTCGTPRRRWTRGSTGSSGKDSPTRRCCSRQTPETLEQ